VPKKTGSLLVRSRSPQKTWLDQLTDEQREEAEGYRVACKAGEGVATPTARAMIEAWGLSIGAQTVSKWLLS
jgi:hypothetical protein